MGMKLARLEPKLRLVHGQGAANPAAPAPSPSPPAFDDSELLAAIRRGDAGAAAALHDRVRPQVDRTVRRLLGARDPDVCDLAQQSMIEIVRTIDRYRGECSLDSWTSAVAAHVFIDCAQLWLVIANDQSLNFGANVKIGAHEAG